MRKPPPPRRRRGRTFLLGTAVVVAMLWTGYWFASSQMASAAIAQATSAAAAGGRMIGCDGDAVGGFPLSLDLSCTRATLSSPDEDLSAEISMVSATAPLYRPGHIEAKVGGPFVFNAPSLGIALSATWTRAVAHVDASIKGVTQSILELDGLKVVRAGEAGKLPFIRLSATSARFAAIPQAGGAYQFASSANGMQLVQSADKVLPSFDSEARVTALAYGTSLGTDPQKTFARWLAAGGSMKVERLAFSAGPTSIAANGDLTISRTGLLSGVLTVRFAGLEALPDLVDSVQPGQKKNVANVVAVLSAVTLPVPTAKGGLDRQTVLFFRDGTVSVGLIPIGKIAPLRF